MTLFLTRLPHRQGSVIADFWLVYRELSTVEIIALATYLDEKKVLGTMRIGYWYMNYTEGKAKLVFCSLFY